MNFGKYLTLKTSCLICQRRIFISRRSLHFHLSCNPCQHLIWNFPFPTCHLHDYPGNCQSGEIRVSVSTLQPTHIPALEFSFFHHCCISWVWFLVLFWGTHVCPEMMIKIVSTRGFAKLRAWAHMLGNPSLKQRQLRMTASLCPIVTITTDGAFLHPQGSCVILASTLLPRAGPLWWLAVFSC